MEGYHLATDKLCKSFGSYHALIDINLRIERGQIVVIIGGSGAGKTTLLKILVGLDNPTSGAVYLSGMNLSKLSARELNQQRKRFGMVFICWAPTPIPSKCPLPACWRITKISWKWRMPFAI